MIQLNNEQYWLYAAINSDTNDLLHTKLESTRNNVLAHVFFAKLREKHDVSDVPRTFAFWCARKSSALANAVFLVDGAPSLQITCQRHGLDFRYEQHGNRNSVERVFREIKHRTTSFSNCFSNATTEAADEWLKSFAFAWNQLI